MKKQEQVYVCGQCIHYVNHYVIWDAHFVQTALGHCIYPRVKGRKIHAKACAHVEQRQKPL